MSNKQGKIWGETTAIIETPHISIHYLDIKKGGYCSEHCHERKNNFFYVIEGDLMVITYRDNNNCRKIKDITLLTAGKEMNIEPGLFHQFKAETDVKCMEIYTVGELSEDIIRRSQGGLKKYHER